MKHSALDQNSLPARLRWTAGGFLASYSHFPARDLLLRAKHLIVAATFSDSALARWTASRSLDRRQEAPHSPTGGAWCVFRGGAPGHRGLGRRSFYGDMAWTQNRVIANPPHNYLTH